MFDRLSNWVGDVLSIFSSDAPDPVAESATAAYESFEENFGIPEERDTSWADSVTGAPEGFEDFVETNQLLDPNDWDSMTVHIDVGGGYIEYTVDGETYTTDWLDVDPEEDNYDLWLWAEYISDVYDIEYDKEIDS